MKLRLPNRQRKLKSLAAHLEPTVATRVETKAPTSVQRPEPTILTFENTLDRAHAEEMRQALLAAMKSGVEHVRYDLSKTTNLDPVGLAFLAASKQQARELEFKSIEFRPVSDEIQLVLRMSGIASP